MQDLPMPMIEEWLRNERERKERVQQERIYAPLPERMPPKRSDTEDAPQEEKTEETFYMW
jgi:hypothetical protein